MKGFAQLWVPLLAACASEAPLATGSAASSASEWAVVTLLGGDFATLDGVRMPLDEVVLRLRWRVRALGEDQLAVFGVQVRVDDAVPESEDAALAARQGRMIDDLVVMGVRWART